MFCSWEGNRRSGVALVMRHRLQWFIRLRAHGLRKGDENPAYTRRGVWHSFTFACIHVNLTTVGAVLVSGFQPVSHVHSAHLTVLLASGYLPSRKASPAIDR